MNKRIKVIILGVIAVALLLSAGVFTKNELAKSRISLNQTTLRLKVGETKQLSVRGTSKKVRWKSTDTSVATVSSKGLVKGIAPGEIWVIAKTAGRKLKCTVRVSTVSPTQSPAPTPIFYYFRNADRLTEHYNKHGIEMGFASEQAYLEAANAVIHNPNALHKLEAEDNDHVYFIEATGEIVFLSQDGYIRTYFIADKAYYERQSAQQAA